MKGAKHWWSCLTAGILLWPVVSLAQLKMGLAFKDHTYIQCEPVRVYLAIENDTDSVLEINRSDTNNTTVLDFVVEHENGHVSRRISPKPIFFFLRVKPGERRVSMVPLYYWYDIRDMGKYLVTARIRWQGKVYYTEKKVLEVVHGVELTQLEKNLPGYADQTRVYSLRYWGRGRRESLFLCVSDPKKEKNWGVFDLGPLVRVMDPELTVDRKGLIQVLHQSGRDRFTRTRFEISGEGIFFKEQTHHTKDGHYYPDPSVKPGPVPPPRPRKKIREKPSVIRGDER